MTEKEFARVIYNITDCQNCPIKTFCDMVQTITCLQSARLYYRTHGKDGMKWEEVKENFHQHTTTLSIC